MNRDLEEAKADLKRQLRDLGKKLEEERSERRRDAQEKDKATKRLEEVLAL